jgi:hypothetical protein
MARRIVRRLALRASLAWSVAVSVASVEHIARADASLADKAAAQTLFDEGRKLMAAGKFPEACPKLAESQRLDPGVGTQFHLADCYERLGQTASAWAGFLEAAAGAKSMGQLDREKVAKERAAALAPRLSKVTITSAQSTIAGLEIKRDGAVVGRPLWGTAIPVDPGPHSIEATAPGKKPWQTTVKVEGEKADVVVTIPALDDAPPEATAVAPMQASVDTSSVGKNRRTLGLVVGGVGIVGLGVGTVFALQAKSKNDDSLPFCPVDKNLCSARGVTLRDEARTSGTIATVAMGAGAVAVAAGAVLFFTAPSGSAEKASVWLVPTPGGAALGVAGSY